MKRVVDKEIILRNVAKIVAEHNDLFTYEGIYSTMQKGAQHVIDELNAHPEREDTHFSTMGFKVEAWQSPDTIYVNYLVDGNVLWSHLS